MHNYINIPSNVKINVFMRSHVKHGQAFFQNRNVKDLKCGDFEDFLNSLDLADKIKHNIISIIHVFYK